jgi:RNA polymerase sigma-70 factor (ECF subfamily)
MRGRIRGDAAQSGSREAVYTPPAGPLRWLRAAAMTGHMNGTPPARPTDPTPPDDELMRRVAGGDADALAILHRRHARLVFRIAAQTLDRAAAEDVVQDVFVAAWRNAGRFDPARGTLRAWLLQMAHFRVLNELRRRSRQPAIAPDPDGLLAGGVPADDPGPAEIASRRSRRAVVESAFAGLPPAQREAVSLAFLRDLTHEEVAAELGLPLGTAKTRIRAGLRNLRGALAAHGAALLALGLLVALGVRYRAERATSARYDRALSMVTASDSVNLRLAAVPGIPAETHARYRGRPGTPIAVVVLSGFPPAPPGEAYQVWARRSGVWTSLGTASPDASGTARVIAEGESVTALPEALEVTREPGPGSAAPRGPAIVVWTPGAPG